MNTVANIQHKSSVFCMLFSDEELLRELYCALENVTLPPDIPVSINTLNNALFMGKVNDISFEIDGKLIVLIEHQSTINPNMALRLLMYIGRVYEKTISGDTIYSEKLLRIPRPEFFVLYNGTDAFPDEKTYKLSDAFHGLAPLGLSEHEKVALELEVRVLNINEGRNADIAHRCRKLAEYSAFIGKVREFEKEFRNREAAITEAVRYCRRHDILKMFLEEHGAEVISMLSTEYDPVVAKAVWQAEAMEKGLARGREGVARNLLAAGMPADEIARIAELPIEQVRELNQGVS